MRKIFRGLKPGDVCTGTVHRFNLQSARLVKLGYIEAGNGEWIFRGLRKSPTRG